MKKRVGIIGGGIIGTATAYFLSQYPEAEVTLFEKNSIGSGTTAKSAATFCLIDDSVSHEFWSVRLFGFNFYTGLEKRFPGSTGFEKTGTLTVCPYKQYEMYVKQAVALTLASGYHAEYWTEAEKISQIIPDLNLEGVLGAGWCPDDGFFDATMTANTLARLAREGGVQVHIGTKVIGFTTANGRVTGLETSKGHFDFDVVVDASGPWARHVAQLVGVQLPIWHTKAEVFILEPAEKLGYNFPVLKYPRFYARKDKDNVFICKSHQSMDLNDPMHAGFWDPDLLPMTGGTDAYFWDFLTEELLAQYPRLLESSVVNEWVGYRAEPPDFLPVLGATPVEGYILAAGAGGNGVIEAPTIGRDLADYIMTGAVSWYLDRLPLSRLDSLKYDESGRLIAKPAIDIH
ncbi:MAG: FAD-dependent oxidoreductase [Chloroflexi bacterium RBG_16_57_11]|nr:MAG: FAD-dependent oxidoreductase [Chloroflexi bacterium RBG_16_57_11]